MRVEALLVAQREAIANKLTGEPRASNQHMKPTLQQCGNLDDSARKKRCVRTASCGFICDGETREAAGLARQSETRVATTLPTPMNTHSHVGLHCIDLRLHCIIRAGKASFLRDSD